MWEGGGGRGGQGGRHSVAGGKHKREQCWESFWMAGVGTQQMMEAGSPWCQANGRLTPQAAGSVIPHNVNAHRAGSHDTATAARPSP